MPPVKSLDRISNKWTRQSQAATPEYEAGINNPRRSWSAATVAAEGNYEQGVQAAIGRKAFGNGVRRAGDASWKEGALKKGTARWGPGIAASRAKYEKGFAPYRQAIENIDLPPRGPKGDPANINRVAVIATALHDEKLRIQAGG